MKSSYESPNKRNGHAKKTITIEQNYSQTKKFKKGTLESVNKNKRKQQIKPTPSTNNESISNLGSVHKKAKKKAIVSSEADPNPFQACNKPMSIKVEQ